jgi:hypothetical protein
MQTELLKKDFIHSQCDKPEYKNRMTCSKILYILKRDYLITVSNIMSLIEIKDNSGNMVARDYGAIPEEKFQRLYSNCNSYRKFPIAQQIIGDNRLRSGSNLC